MSSGGSSTAIKLRRQVVVVVVRHGERLDYKLKNTKGINWIPTSKRPWDPPLTKHGVEQAKALGNAIGDILKSHDLPSKISAIYTSPFYRCRQTSAALAMSHSRQYQQKQQQQLTNGIITSNGGGTTSKNDSLQVCVEYGLSESFNENFYRSWSLPDSDSTWGYKRKELPLQVIDPSTLHPISTQPVQQLLQVTMEYNGNGNDYDENNDDNDTTTVTNGDNTINIKDWIDTSYISKTNITTPYSLHPPNFESFKMQRQRMEDTLNELSKTHFDNEAFIMVSHGTYTLSNSVLINTVLRQTLPLLPSPPKAVSHVFLFYTFSFFFIIHYYDHNVLTPHPMNLSLHHPPIRVACCVLFVSAFLLISFFDISDLFWYMHIYIHCL